MRDRGRRCELCPISRKSCARRRDSDDASECWRERAHAAGEPRERHRIQRTVRFARLTTAFTNFPGWDQNPAPARFRVGRRDDTTFRVHRRASVSSQSHRLFRPACRFASVSRIAPPKESWPCSATRIARRWSWPLRQCHNVRSSPIRKSNNSIYRYLECELED